jgi:hypothetical protein
LCRSLFFVVILNEVKDPCISPLFLLLPVLKSVSSVQISVKPSVLKQVWDVGTEAKSVNALKSKDMLTDLEYSYSPVRDKVRALREYL